MEQSRDDFIIAIRSAFLKKGNKQRFSLLSLILFSIIFLILGNFNFRIIEFNKTVIKEIVYLSSFIVSIPENTINKSFQSVSDHFNHYEDYQKNKSKLQELKNKDLSKEIIEFENMELKRLIEDYLVEDEQVYAKVLIDKESPFLRSIVINKGSKNGVLAGMIAFDDIYLIGKVVEVNFLTSRVLLISDINSKVPVTIQPINIEAIMSGLSQQQGKLEYIKTEQLDGINNEELIIVTSGSGGVFKSGIPIGKINPREIVSNNEMVVDFYKDFSQLKYVKISSYQKDVKLDQSSKKIFNEGKDKILKINNLIEEIKVLKQQRIITDEIRNKFEKENTKLKQVLIKTQRELKELNKSVDKINKDKEEIKFLELNLLYGHKCRKTFLKANLHKVDTPEYRNCVLNKGVIKN
jgi:rod shape-determining protein MreC